MSKLKFLLIEDDDDQRELIRQTLEDHFGAGTVVEAGSAAAAIAQDLAAFDLILADYNLPDCTGMELLDEVRAPLRDAGDHGDRRKRRRTSPPKRSAKGRPITSSSLATISSRSR